MKKTLWTKNFICITLANFLLFVGFEMVVTLVSLYINHIGGTNADIGMCVAVFTVTALIGRSVAGVLLDRFGRKGVFFGGLILMVLITYSYGFVTAVGWIVAVRFVHGIGWGFSSTASSTVASDNIPKECFGEGMGYFSLSNSLGMAVGPSIGLALLSFLSFRTMFGFSASTALAALVIALFVSYEPAQKKQPEAEQPETGTAEAKPAGKWIEKKALLPAVVILCVSTTYGAMIGFLALYGNQENIGNTGLFFAVYAIFLLISRPIAGKLTDRKGFAVVVIPGILCTAVALVILGFAHTMPVFLLSAAIYGVGIGANQSALQTMAVLSADKDSVGSANATFLLGFDGGIGVGSLVAGWIAQLFGYAVMYHAMIGFLILGIVIFGIGSRQSSIRKQNAEG